MKESYLFDMSLNNIVFLGRNKAYGAYILRKSYSRNLTVAALVGTLVFIGFLAAPIINSIYFSRDKQNSTIPIADPLESIPVPILPKPEPPKPKTEAQVPVQPIEEKVATKKYVAPKVVKNDVETPEDVPDQIELQNALIGTKDQEGIKPETPSIVSEPEAPEGIGGTETEPTEPFIIVDQMPQFGEGERDLLNYLSKKIRYPSRARAAGVEGLVVVSFVVNAMGKVQDVKVVKGLGYGTEEEAIRVVENMPNWKPGKQNGRAVPVRYTLPIRLQMQN